MTIAGALHHLKVTIIRGRVNDRMEMDSTLNYADIRCLKIIQVHHNEDQQAARGQCMEKDIIWTIDSMNMIGGVRAHLEGKAEVAIPIVIGKAINHLYGIAVAAALHTLADLRIAMLYSRGYL
jgi:hypothetical protein